MHIQRRTTALLLAIASLLALGMALPTAAQAGTHVYTSETYYCAWKNPPNGSPDQWRTCDGTWWNASAKEFGRSIRIVADVSWNANSGWHFQGVYYAQNLKPEIAKTIHWYCRYSNGSFSALKGTSVLGGGIHPSYTWNPEYQPCNGYGTGLVADVVSKCQGETYTTRIDLNSVKSGPGEQSAWEDTDAYWGC
jgi:hypothetical protein